MTIAALVARGPLRMGATGPAVVAVQTALANAGYTLELDGDFGRNTQIALKSWEASHGLPPDGVVDGRTALELDKILPPPSVLKVAPWLTTMRALNGLKEAPGDKDNPFIIEMAHEVVRRYPDLKGTVAWYNHDSIPWCGLDMAYVMAINGIKPPAAPLGAGNWADWGERLRVPTPGAVLVFKRTGGHHVTLYESEQNGVLYCRGGNQDDMINVSRRGDTPMAIRWPPGLPLPTAGRKYGVTPNAVAIGKEA